MKKYFIILLMLVYGLPSTGASLHLHFCCGKLDDVSFSVKHKASCDKQEMGEKVCCNNVALDLKMDVDQEPVAKQAAWLNLLPAISHQFYTLPAILPASAIFAANRINGPPPGLALIAVYIKNCVFRI